MQHSIQTKAGSAYSEGDAVRPTVGLLKHTRPLPTMRAHVAQDGDEVDSGSIVAVEHKGPWLPSLITARAVAVVTLL